MIAAAYPKVTFIMAHLGSFASQDWSEHLAAIDAGQALSERLPGDLLGRLLRVPGAGGEGAARREADLRQRRAAGGLAGGTLQDPPAEALRGRRGEGALGQHPAAAPRVTGGSRHPATGADRRRRRALERESQIRDRWLAGDPDAGQRHRLPREAAWHHADLSVTWGKVWVKLKTHSAGGITDKDFALAKKIEGVVLWRPEPGSPLEGTPNNFVRGRSERRESPTVSSCSTIADGSSQPVPPTGSPGSSGRAPPESVSPLNLAALCGSRGRGAFLP